jgi:hypothetical protein
MVAAHIVHENFSCRDSWLLGKAELFFQTPNSSEKFCLRHLGETLETLYEFGIGRIHSKILHAESELLQRRLFLRFLTSGFFHIPTLFILYHN